MKTASIIINSIKESETLSEFVMKNANLFQEHKEGYYLTDYLPDHVIEEILNKFESNILEKAAEGDCEIEFCYCLTFKEVKHSILEKAICWILDRFELFGT